MRNSNLTPGLLFILPGLALADGSSTQCTYGDMVRRVTIMSEPGVSVPCEVHYFKDTEAPGDDQVLWSASQQAGYCEQKAAGLVEKLEGFGWDCGASDAAAESEATPDTAESGEDTTGDLAPADPDSGGN
jgi:hypothetical protein